MRKESGKKQQRKEQINSVRMESWKEGSRLRDIQRCPKPLYWVFNFVFDWLDTLLLHRIASHRRPRVVCWSWTMDSLDWPPTMHFLSISHFPQWKLQTKYWQTFSYTCAFSPFHLCKYLTHPRITRICRLSNLHYLSPSLVSVSPFNNNRSYSLISLKGATWIGIPNFNIFQTEKL